MESRLNYLDGLRGIAILLVIAYHAYSRWPEVVPYGNIYENFPLFKQGKIGVQLFFLISGFVIFMSLDKTDSFKQFLYKRWIRLFPTMLIVSSLIYISSSLFPLPSRSALNLLPGMTFIEPYWWSKLTGIEIKSLEGSFWSLYVEFKFYIISGLLYFYLGRKYLTPTLFLLFTISQIIFYIPGKEDLYFINMLHNICINLSLKYFGWFTAGTLFYLYFQNNKKHYFFIGISVGYISSILTLNSSMTIAAIMVTTLFAAALKSQIIQKTLSNKAIVFIGFISYPLYLIHENTMIYLIVKFSNYLSWLNFLFHPVIPLIILISISSIIAKNYEIKVRNTIIPKEFNL